MSNSQAVATVSKSALTRNYYSASLTVMGFLCALLCMVNTVSAAPICTENAVAVVNNWGWENNGSCRVITTACEDTPPIGDGWGWNGSDSCRVPASACVDSPPLGDGWGWNGTDSCEIPAAGTEQLQPQTFAGLKPVEPCTDTAPTGDGWGWNGTGSCATVWSIASYPGWTQLSPAPSTIPYRHFTHIMHFAMYPTDSGDLSLGDIFTEANADAAVSAAHAAGTKIVLVIGGEGEGDKFIGATRPDRISGFVNQVISRMRKHNYDGISIDWEEDVIDDRLVELTKRFATEFSQMTPRPLLTVDILSNFISADTAAQIAPYVDALNIMSYFIPNKIENEFSFYNSAGVAASKVVMGIGLFDDADDTPTRVVQKMNYAKRLGFKGAELWSTEFADWDGALFNNYVNNRWK